MSIIEKNGQETIQMPGFWETLLKLSVLLALPVFGLGSSWAIWITNAHFRHDRDIAVMQGTLSEIKSRVHGVSSQIGQLPGKMAAAVKPVDND